MKAEIICVGTELLLGDIVNTDAQYLARELASMGITMLYQSTVGDNRERLSALLQTALSRSDIIITTGGLGPTEDDLTKEVCCEALGVELVLDEEILGGIKTFFEGRGSKMTENNVKQAYVPKGGTVLFNSNGTAPGCAVEKDGNHIIMLPGPPRELVPMFDTEVKKYLGRFSDGVIFSRNVRMFGIGEAAMAQQVSDLFEMENPTVAPYAKDYESLLRVTAKAETRRQAAAMCDEVVDIIKARLGEYIYGIDAESLQQRAVELLRKNGMTVAAAESCTGGYLAKRITEIDGASEVFGCGAVTYSNSFKQKLLGVKEETLNSFTAVSEQTAAEMAQGVRQLGQADIGIGITGYSGPSGGTEKDPVGTAYIGFSTSKGTTVRAVRTGRSTNSREYNRYAASSAALYMIIEYLSKGGAV